ncbi:permease [Burkholderia multivorans]|uniref:Permease n=1 Tax=Burkholderia multivorans TaxID=87883 RepID=A0A2S9M8P6_9BURK|nr:permease [Burkholderia multivorans]MBR7893475.1 permease [Burkholderia multivorans]MBU9523510.1 permease [Burkholderia multivorans]MBU9535778.1 permease [Burkholderia multivorans]MBU9604660.1 permease [Burkholderia multivorans]MBU9622092.1 permease [Burkholderia multivorans]
MNKKEAKAKIAALLAAGTRKAEVLANLSGQGLKDRVLARLIASRPDPERCRRNKVHVRILIGIAVVQLLISLDIAYSLFELAGRLGSSRGSGQGVTLLFVALTVPLALLFIWGFATNRVGTYHAFIALSLLQLPKTIADLTHDPSDALPTLAITAVLIGYVWFVRNRMFPDYGWFTPRKIDGRYAFVDRAS